MPEDMNEAVSDILGSGGDSLPDDIMVAAVENYVKHFNNGDYEGVADLFAETATVEDPIGTPINTETPMAMTAIVMVILAPKSIREKISDPILSVPKKCCTLGPMSLSAG